MFRQMARKFANLRTANGILLDATISLVSDALDDS